MNENIRESRRGLVWSISVILAGFAGLWWGIRTGGATMWISRADPRPALCAAMLLALLIQGFSNMKKDRKYPPLYRILVWYSGIMIPVLIYGLGSMFVGDIIIVVIHLVQRSSRITFSLSALIALPISLVVTVYGLIHARQPIVQHYNITLPRYADTADSAACVREPSHPAVSDSVSRKPSHISVSSEGVSAEHSSEFSSRQNNSLHPVRIVQLSDLHMGTVVTPAYVHKILRKTASLNPDYVVLTGDIFNHGYVEETAHRSTIESWFQELNAPTYAVLGNHDPQPDDPALQDFLTKSKITLLYNRTVSLPEFYLAGRGGNHVNHRPDLSTWLSSTHEGKPLILLDHYPDSIHEAERANVDLLLSGHTHGGQYFPCDLLIRKHYAHGLMHGWSLWGNTQSIVSWGAGFFQIPIRVGTSSEIVCIDLIET